LYANSRPGVSQSAPPFTGDGLAHFKDHEGLRTLWLTNLTIDGKMLAALKDLKQLRELTLMMPSLTDDEVRALQAALPKTRVSAAWGGHGIAPLQLDLGLKRREEASRSKGDDVLFEDDFRSGMSDKWQIVGLDKSDYRVRDGGLEMRVQPGSLSADTPMLRLPLSFTSADTVVVSVKVTLLDEFTQDHEFAGVFLLADNGREFAAKKERVDGKLVFAPGDYEFQGESGEEGDPAKYEVNYTAESKEAGPLRIVVDRGNAFYQVGPSADDKYLNFFHSAIRKVTNQRGFCLAAAGAHAGSSHWVRFEDFRVFRR